MAVELDGANQKVILDSDSDTYLQASTDDTLDMYIAGAKDFVFTANTLTAESGSTIAAQALTATTFTVDNIIANGTTIGHTDDTDLITLADGVATVAGELDATTLDISGNADIDGTANLDIVDIDGAVDMASTLAVAGVSSFAVAANVAQGAITSSSNAVAWDATAKPNAFHVTTENTTFSAPSNAVEGAFVCLEINYNGSHTIGWNAIFNFAADTAPTTTDTDAKTDIFVFRYNGAIWQEIGRTLNIPES